MQVVARTPYADYGELTMTYPARLPLRPRAIAAWRRVPDRVRFGFAVAAAVLGAVLCDWLPQSFTLPSVETVVLVIAALGLRTAGMAALSVVVGILVAVVATSNNAATVAPSGIALLILVAVVSILQAVRRDSLGLGRTSPESVIDQVRHRLEVQGEVPALPAQWHVDVQQRTADGAAIAGDFVSSRLHQVDGELVMDLAVVDVSGKGIDAAPRALLLSGAVGGLLGSVPPDDLLQEVNRYLLRQRWAAGFATCVYVRLELDTGRFAVRAAGHPSPLLRSASGTWSTCDAPGTLLGVIPDLAGVPGQGELEPGDLLVLVTDGVIEDRIASLEDGTNRLMDAADRRLSVSAAPPGAGPGWAGGAPETTWDPRFGLASVLVETVPTRRDDDRAVVTIWRSALDALPTGRSSAGQQADAEGSQARQP